MHKFYVFVVRVCALLVAIGLALAVPGCGPAVFISPYDEVTDQQVTGLQKSVDGLLATLDRTPVPDYASAKPTYDQIRSDLASLRARNTVRTKNQITVQQLDALQKELQDLEDQHRNSKLIQVMVPPARDTLDATFLAILKLEIAKKEQAN